MKTKYFVIRYKENADISNYRYWVDKGDGQIIVFPKGGEKELSMESSQSLKRDLFREISKEELALIL